MIKKNNRGFALVETLVVATFISSILVILYSNLYPIMGQIEKRESFDDIESIYKTYLVKKMIETDSNKNQLLNGLTQNHFKKISCYDHDLNDSNNLISNKLYCEDLSDVIGIDEMFVTTYKVQFDNEASVPSSASDIKDYLLSFSENNGTKCNYRVIVRYKYYINDEIQDKPVYKFASMGVDC